MENNENTDLNESPEEQIEKLKAKNRQLFERAKRAEQRAKEGNLGGQEDLLKKFQTVEAQKEHWRKKAEQSGSVAKLQDVMNYGKQLAAFDNEELDFLKKFAGSDDLGKILAASKDKMAINVIEMGRRDVALESKIPASGLVQSGKDNTAPAFDFSTPEGVAKHKEAFFKSFKGKDSQNNI